MINNLDEYLNKQNELFDKLTLISPQLEKLEKAKEVGTKLLNFINNEIDKADMDAFNSLDFKEIAENCNININKNLDGDMLSSIYQEIEETFEAGGKVSLEDYLLQGGVIYKDLQNELAGSVDYSINYSEEELENAEQKAFETFSTIMTMNNINMLKTEFEENKDLEQIIIKNNEYLDVLKGEPFAENIEEKLAEINGLLIAMEYMDDLECDIKSLDNLKSLFSEKIKDTVEDLGIYRNDENISNMFSDIENNVDRLGDSSTGEYKELFDNIQNQLGIVRETVFEAELIDNIDNSINNNGFSL